jgi:hypothetical protein
MKHTTQIVIPFLLPLLFAACLPRKAEPLISATSSPTLVTPPMAQTITPTPMLTPTLPPPTHTPTPTVTIQAPYEQTVTWRCGSVADIALVDEKTGWAVVNCSVSLPPRSLHKGIIYRLVDGNWQRVEGAPVLGPPYSCYRAISAVGPEEMWATGLTGGIYTCQWGTWVLHYKNGKWENVDIDKKLFTWHYTGLRDIYMVDAENGWAVGYGLIFRYKQGQWLVELDLPCEGSDYCHGSKYTFETINMADINEGWAGGNDGLLFHYERGKWTRWQDPIFKSATIMDIQAMHSGEAWAVGFHDVEVPLPGSCPHCTLTISAPLIWHYVNGNWYETTPLTGEAELTSIKMSSLDEGWAVGRCVTGYTAECKDGSLVLHYTDGHWENVMAPPEDFAHLQSTAIASLDHIWIGGWGFYRYLPSGQWEHIELPSAGVWPYD